MCGVKMDKFKGELKPGDKIKLFDEDDQFETIGTVIFTSPFSAEIKRNDDIQGGGRYLEGYGELWYIIKRNGIWNNGSQEGYITKIFTCWRDKIENLP